MAVRVKPVHRRFEMRRCTTGGRSPERVWREKKMSAPVIVLAIFVVWVCTAVWVPTTWAQSPEDEAEALRKAQDPLADVRALMTDNTIAFGTADDQTSYGFQFQPVYSIPTDRGFNFIARGIVPIVGAQQGAGRSIKRSMHEYVSIFRRVATPEFGRGEGGLKPLLLIPTDASW